MTASSKSLPHQRRWKRPEAITAAPSGRRRARIMEERNAPRAQARVSLAGAMSSITIYVTGALFAE